MDETASRGRDPFRQAIMEGFSEEVTFLLRPEWERDSDPDAWEKSVTCSTAIMKARIPEGALFWKLSHGQANPPGQQMRQLTLSAWGVSSPEEREHPGKRGPGRKPA